MRDVWVWLPAEEIDEERGGVVHEDDDQEVVQHGDTLAQQRHGVRLAEVQGVQLHPGEVGGDDVGHLQQGRALPQLGQGQDQQRQDAPENVPVRGLQFTIYSKRSSKSQEIRITKIISFKTLPEREHNDDIVVAVVQILVADHAEHDDHVEDNDQGGGGAVAAHPGPGYAPPLPLTGPGAWLHCLLHL